MPVPINNSFETNMEWSTIPATHSGPTLLSISCDGRPELGPTSVRPEPVDDNSHEHC